MVMRIYGRIWDKKICKEVKLNKIQKGFVPGDGCFENVGILKRIIASQRSKRRAYQIVFLLDLAKAFNTVNHESIRQVLMRKEVPTKIISGILVMYRGASNVIRVGGKFTRRININTRVKQGSPLSPLLFNVIMDKLIERIEQKNVGIKVRNEIKGVMAFTDDLVLLAEDPGDMTILLKYSEDFFDEKGLLVNSTKCVSFKVLPVKGKTVVTDMHQHWKGEPMPMIDFEKLEKYLGPHINHTRKVELPRSLWKVNLNRIKKWCLTPLQKIRVIKEVISSKILYQIRLSDHGLEEARKFDRIIIAKVK